MNRKTCPICGGSFVALRRDKQTCGPACKKALQRGGWRVKTGLKAWSPGRYRNAGNCPPLLQSAGSNPSATEKGQLPASQAWPHGTEVWFSLPGMPLKKPARVEWIHTKGTTPECLIEINAGFQRYFLEAHRLVKA